MRCAGIPAHGVQRVNRAMKWVIRLDRCAAFAVVLDFSLEEMDTIIIVLCGTRQISKMPICFGASKTH